MNSSTIISKKLEELEARVTILETNLPFGLNNHSNKTENDFSGIKGGLVKLVMEGYFKKPIGLSEVRSLLTNLGYIYPRQSVNNALKRLSTTTGKLVSIKGSPIKYAERK